MRGCVLRQATKTTTGKERDTESGNDYFGARYYASSMGRLMSPDWYPGPAPIPYANIFDPQTLNLYIYAGNNPLSRFDANGHNWFTQFAQGLPVCHHFRELAKPHRIEKF
jgi:RHS repeat-associated protein